MKKPKMESIRFESGDVIATSAQPIDYFINAGIADGIPGNLIMIFNGEDKTGKGGEVLTYLTGKYGTFDYVGFTKGNPEVDIIMCVKNADFISGYSKDTEFDNRSYSDLYAELLNGKFNYYGVRDVAGRLLTICFQQTTN